MLGKVRDWIAVWLGVALCVGWTSSAQAADQHPPCPPKTRCVLVADPYLELHSGPGVGYPVVNVAERGEEVQVLGRRTDWFYVRTQRQIEGWVSHDQMLATLELTGQPIDIHEPTQEDYASHRWEGGAFLGRYAGASLLGIYTGYALSDHLTAELDIASASGESATRWFATIGLNHVIAPEQRVSPYVGIGTGYIKTTPRTTLVQPADTSDQLGYVAAGVRGYIQRRFLWRFEYRGNVVFTTRNENEEIHEWKLGFAFFF